MYYRSKHKQPGFIAELIKFDRYADKVDFCPQGGGFVYTISVSEWESDFEPYEPRNTRQLMQVCIDGPPVFTGWVNPDYRWNGWLCPVFEFDEAVRIMEAWNKQYTENEHCTWTMIYDKGKDEFRSWDADVENPHEEDVYVAPAEWMTKPDGTKVKVYCIFDGYCWSEYDPQEDGDA